ncbi:MAG TPA: DUF4149 domain-containing protein [Steroidobacteraceae bacterium]
MIAYRTAAVLLALWAGSLLTVCALVAPTLFALLERSLAGRVAGRLFFAETVIGVVAAIGIFIAQRIGRFSLSRAATIGIVVAAGLPLASEIVLSPLMQAARSAGDMARFGLLHGVSAVLFAGACAAALFALWNVSRPAV